MPALRYCQGQLTSPLMLFLRTYYRHAAARWLYCCAGHCHADIRAPMRRRRVAATDAFAYECLSIDAAKEARRKMSVRRQVAREKRQKR